ncbi:uncharacterized protein [Salvelinus alpinus]|uniref:uncharacterized protein isoform X2 n=1 Tax=Salvelinus alpinus TaxID=8036 RepID=UPI0039FC0D84
MSRKKENEEYYRFFLGDRTTRRDTRNIKSPLGFDEERRSAACYCSPPTSHHSPQLKDFFRCGEVVRPLDPSLPSPSAEAQTELAEEEGTVAPIQPQDLGLSLGTDLGEPEVAAEAYSEMGGSPTPVEETELPDELENRVPSQFQPCVLGTDQSQSQGPPTVPGLWAICDSYKDIVRLIYLPEVFYNVLI